LILKKLRLEYLYSVEEEKIIYVFFIREEVNLMKYFLKKNNNYHFGAKVKISLVKNH
jgi:hypothetical protein